MVVHLRRLRPPGGKCAAEEACGLTTWPATFFFLEQLGEEMRHDRLAECALDSGGNHGLVFGTLATTPTEMAVAC